MSNIDQTTNERLENLEKDVWILKNPETFKNGDDVIASLHGKLTRCYYSQRYVTRIGDSDYPKFKCTYEVFVNFSNKEGSNIFRQDVDEEPLLLKPEDLKNV